MSQPLETGYVEILPDFSKFAREVRKDLRVEMARLEIEVRDAARGMERAISNAARDAGRALATDIGLGAAAAKLALHSVQTEADGMSRKVRRAAKDARGDLEEVFSRSFLRAIADGFGEIGRVVGQLFAQIGKIPPLLLIIAALIPPIIALTSALLDVVGLIAVIPAGVAVLASTIIPAVVAFQNFGTALELLAQGTPKTKAELEKLNEALGKLAPSARVVARELVGMLPVLRDIQIQVQQAFFQPLQGVFPQLAAILAGPVKNGFTAIASALGNLVAKILIFFSSAENVATLNKLFAATARIINAFAGPAGKLFEAIGTAIVAALPFIERIATAFGGALESFAAFIDESVRTGKFQQFVEDAFTTLKELGALLKSIGGFLSTVFAATNEEGHNLIGTLTELFNRLNDFLKTREGQDALKELVFLVKLFAGSLEAVLEVLIFLQTVFSTSIDFLHAIGVAVTDLAINNLGLLVHAAAAAFAWIPGLGPKLQQASNEFDEWAKDVLRQINELDGKTITINIKTIANAAAKGALGGGIPHLAGGGLALDTSTIAEAGKPELALPLNDPRAQAAIRAALGELGGGGTTINFGAGAIQVLFEGFMPTIGEAKAAGQAVADGLVSQLAARQVHLAVRAM